MLEPREPVHSDVELQAMLARALEENAMLRRALDQQTLPLRTRRWVGRTIAGLILALGTALGALYATRSHDAAEFRRGFDEGRSAKAIGEGPNAPRRAATTAPVTGPVAPAAAPAPPAPVIAPAPATPRP